MARWFCDYFWIFLTKSPVWESSQHYYFFSIVSPKKDWGGREGRRDEVQCKGEGFFGFKKPNVFCFSIQKLENVFIKRIPFKCLVLSLGLFGVFFFKKRPVFIEKLFKLKFLTNFNLPALPLRIKTAAGQKRVHILSFSVVATC